MHPIGCELELVPERPAMDHRDTLLDQQFSDVHQMVLKSVVALPHHERPLGALGSQDGATLGP
eukprot:10317912-Alexandrium_andersonii.AAC.1